MLVSTFNSKGAWFAALGIFQLFILGVVWTSQSTHYKLSAQPPWTSETDSETNATNARKNETEQGRDLFTDIRNRTLGFEKIFVINLPKRTDLRDSMSLAASLTDIDVEFIDGVVDVDRKTLPPGATADNLHGGSLGCWRAHLDVLRTIIERNYSSALVLEADADWDVRIKSQMQDFSKASRVLLQPTLNSTDHFLDPSIENWNTNRKPVDFHTEDAMKTVKPASSPYGDLGRWDLFWLGHCGMKFPDESDQNTPLGRVVIPDDKTVPGWEQWNVLLGDSSFSMSYPQHTRVVSRARMNTCTSGYAVSLPGARRLLYEFSIHMTNAPIDMLLRSACHGSEGRKMRTCLSVTPEIFQYHRPAGDSAGFSDIDNHGGHQNKYAFSPNIRWSTKVNIPLLVDGRTDFIEQYEDGPASA